MTRTARGLAVEAVRRVIDERAYSNRLLPELLARSGLDGRDRAFATELTYGTLRRLLPIDRALGASASRPVDRMSPGARAVVRVGAYQLLYAKVAPHAAVGETVSEAKPSERGFANAVLRRIAKAPLVEPQGDGDEEVAARTGLAPWAVGELRRIVGGEAEAAAAALASPPTLCLRVNTCAVSADRVLEAWHAAGLDPRPAALDPTCFLLDGSDPARLPGFHEGWFAVQDQASAFVVRALDPQPGDRVLDVCAAPGGKAAFAACLVPPGGSVVAADLSPARLGPTRRLFERLEVSARVLAQDARRPALRGPFDRILVDAPCSGIGSARRRPELLWRVERNRLSTLARAQVAIAAEAAGLLEPGGRLVYSVCTFPRAETDAARDAILRHRPDLRPVGVAGPDGEAETHRVWPHRHGSDAMYVAAFERTG